MDRRLLLSSVLLVAASNGPRAQSRGSMAQEFASIGAGPFEFPISGRFRLTAEGGATVFEAEDKLRRYIVGSFRNIAGRSGVNLAAQANSLEPVVRASWERFAKEESGVVVVPFGRTTASAAVLFYMATEFNVRGEVQYYVQFAATNGPRVASVFVEGPGPARPVLDELLPRILEVKVSNE